MARNKKTLTPTEQLKHLKSKKRALFGAEIGCAIAPMGILTAIHFKEYFVYNEAWRTSLSFVMLAGMTVISAGLIVKDKVKINLLNSLFALVVLDAFLWVLGNLISELAYILLYVVIGFVGAFICETTKKKDTEAIQEIEEGIKKAKTDIIADQYREEIGKPKIKVKIKN